MHYDFIKDVTEPNKVLHFGICGELRLSAAIWTDITQASIRDVQLDCLLKSAQKVSSCLPDYTFWLLAGHGPLQPDTRIVRFQGYWKSLSSRKVEFPKVGNLIEHIKEYEGGLRCFGAVEFPISQLSVAFNVC